jgi:hypothetical protein
MPRGYRTAQRRSPGRTARMRDRRFVTMAHTIRLRTADLPVFLADVAIVGPVLYVAGITAMHLLRPTDIVHYGNTMSAYSVGPYGSISIAAFVSLGASAIALALGLPRALAPLRWSLVGSVLVGLFGVGFVLAGIFRFAPDVSSIEPLIRGETPPTTAGVIHGLAGFGGIAFLICAMLVLSAAFRRDEKWRTFWVSSLALVLFVVGLMLPNPPVVAWDSGGWLGAIEWRFFVGTLVVWLLLAAVRLRSVATRDVARRASTT